MTNQGGAPTGRGSVAATALAAGHRRAAAVADRFDDRWDPHPGSPGPIAAGWALAKLACAGILAPVGAGALGAVANRNTRRIEPLVNSYADRVSRLLAGDASGLPTTRTRHLEATGRFFISSDLHRSHLGNVDIPELQGTKDLYDAALTHYADGEWGLIENGDAEDFWLVGGSTYGVVYDIGRVAGTALRPFIGDGLIDVVYDEHLSRIVENNASTYELILDGFHRQGRYVRLSGNHDDVFNGAAGVAALRRHLPDIEVDDYLVLTSNDRPAAVITHGHHIDSWNSPSYDGIGKFCTWWASSVYDAPTVQARPGVGDKAETEALLGDGLDDHLLTISPRFGANAHLYTSDELRLFTSWTGRWPDDAAEPAPLLVMGHTHAPRIDPVVGVGDRSWPGYFNSGSGVGHGVVTGIEWDGTGGGEPAVRLVAWHRDDSAGGTIRRDVITRSPGASAIGPARSEALDATG